MVTNIKHSIILFLIIITSNSFADEFLAAGRASISGDYATAIKLYAKLAKEGRGGAQYNLAMMYYNGLGTRQDYKQAVYWYTKAAEQGHLNAEAQSNLGVMHFNGLGTRQDYKRAVYWYTKAAENGDAKAQYYLGYMHANGHGVPQSYKETVYWYTKAAAQNYTKAQYKLGHLYANAKGTPQDYIKAYTWYEIASKRGEKSARNERDEIAEKMTSEEIEEALSFVKEWLDGSDEDETVIIE